MTDEEYDAQRTAANLDKLLGNIRDRERSTLPSWNKIFRDLFEALGRITKHIIVLCIDLGLRVSIVVWLLRALEVIE